MGALQLKQVCVQMFRLLRDHAKAGLVHSDLKPENILVGAPTSVGAAGERMGFVHSTPLAQLPAGSPRRQALQPPLPLRRPGK